MKIEQMLAIVAVADNLSFSIAGETLEMAASKVSRLVMDAETQFGHVFFHRTTRKVALTPQGKNFVRVARQILALYSSASSEAEAIRQGRSGRVRLGYSGNVATDILPRIVKMCRDTLPDIELGTTFAWSRSNAKLVQTGELDIALISDWAPHPGLASLCLARKEVFVICGGASELAQKRRVAFADLAEQEFVVGPIEKWHVPRQILIKYFGRHGTSPHISVEADDLMSMEAMISAGMGIGLSYTEPGIPLAHDLVRLPVLDLDERVPVYLQWVEKGLQPVVRTFISKVMTDFGIAPQNSVRSDEIR